MTKRKAGFYWVKKRSGKWEPAQWVSNSPSFEGSWLMSGCFTSFSDRHFDEVGPQIVEPPKTFINYDLGEPDLLREYHSYRNAVSSPKPFSAWILESYISVWKSARLLEARCHDAELERDRLLEERDA